ncbi:MAG: hypothetical protein ACE5HQ_01295 [Gemmatimonadota bacterium]
MDPADAALAGTLGWAGGVPAAQVRLLRNGTATWETITTNLQGQAVFEDLLEGRYRIYAGRKLTQAEAQAAAQPIRAFGDGQTLDVSGPTQVTLQLYADRPGDLVISEIGFAVPLPQQTNGGFLDGLYFEVYNNSDRVIDLDGKFFGTAYPFGSQDWDHTPCAVSQVVRDDPQGLFGRWFLQFPGQGGEYPILPGEAKLVAVAAIDNRPVDPSLLDLSGADFEIGGARSANNPGVPDMLDRGLERFPAELLLANDETYFLAEGIDPASLPILWRDPAQGRGWVRVPREALIDVVSFFALWPEQDRQFPPCIPKVNRDFDRYEGGFLEIGLTVANVDDKSYSRKILRTTGGRRVLQNTNTSAVDFVLTDRTPGTVQP